MRVIGLGVFCLTSWLAGGRTADAQTLPFTLYNNRAAWEAAAGSVTTIDFEGVAPNGSFTAFDNADGFSRFGVRFVGVSPSNAVVPYYLRVVSPTYAPDYDWGSGAVMHGPPFMPQPNNVGGANSAIVITPPADVYAVGGDVMSLFPQGANFIIQVRTTTGVYTPPGNVFTAARPNRTFIGIVSPTRILEIRLLCAGFPAIDNVSFSANPLAPATPTNLQAMASGSTVNISWTPATTGGTPSVYDVLAAASPGGAPVASLSTTSTSLQVPNVPAGTYYLRVRAANVQGQSDPTDEVSVTVGQATGLLTLSPAGLVTLGQSVTLSWQSTPIVSSYLITVLSGPGIAGPATVAQAGCCSVSLPIPTNIAPGTYAIRVSGGGMVSAPIALEVLPATPFVLTTSASSARIGDPVTFSWTDLGLGAGVQYQLFAAQAGTTAFAPVAPAECCSISVTVPPGVSGAFDLFVQGSNTRQSNLVRLQIDS